MESGTYHFCTKAILSGTILEKVGIEVDILPNILEFEFYEDILNPFVHASISLIDDFGLRHAVNLQGTETITIEFVEKLEEQRVLFEKKFYISRIEANAPINDRSDAIVLHLVEEHVIINAVKQISKSYTGSFEQIIKSISEIELGRKIAYKNFKPSAQGPRKVVVPYLTPIEAICWLRDRASSKSGFPMLAYSTLFGNDIIIENMEENLTSTVLNPKSPLRHTSGMRTSQDIAARKIYAIEGFEDVNSENMLHMIETGTIGSRFSVTDINTGVTTRKHYSIRNIVDEMSINDLIEGKFTYNLFDPLLKIGDSLYDLYDANNVHQINTTRTYPQFKNYHDESNGQTSLKYKQQMIKNILNRNTLKLKMDGFLFFAKNISVADKLRLLFLNSDASANGVDVNTTTDHRRSGDYIITSIKNSISKTEHSVVFSGCKVNDLPKTGNQL